MNTSSHSRYFILGAPIIAGAYFLIWFIIPIGWTLGISYFDYSPIASDNNAIGWANYREALVEDDAFWKATVNSLYFALGNVVLGTLLALYIANAIASLKLFQELAKFVYFMPTLFTIVAAAVVWDEIFQPRYGVLNNGLYFLTEQLGLPAFPEIGWTTTTFWSMPTIIFFGLWKYLGIRIIILLAAIEAIPRMYYEAASLDGVTQRQQFRHITIPLIKPALWFVIITGLINSLQVFEPMYVITEGVGGPLRSTMSLVMLINKSGFEYQRFGYSAAVSMLLFLMIMVITFLLFWVRARGRDTWQGETSRK